MNADECPSEQVIANYNFERLRRNRSEELEEVTKRNHALDVAAQFIEQHIVDFKLLDAQEIFATMIWASWQKTYFIDFDYLPHDKVIQVIQVFPGKWEKEPTDEAKINYILRVSERFAIRCFEGQPPPNCQIQEVEEIVPATVRKVKKLVCKEPPKEP